MKQSLDKEFTVKVLWIISGIFIPNDSNSCFYETLIDCRYAYPPFPTSTNPHVSTRTVCAKSAQPCDFSQCSLWHRNVMEAYLWLLGKSQPLNPLPRKVWKQRGPHLEDSVAGARPGVGQCGLRPCCPHTTGVCKANEQRSQQMEQ